MRLKTAIFALCLLLALPVAGACSGKATSTTGNTAATALTTTSGAKPVEVVSILGPMPPFYPGGPNVQLIVKNVSDWPISHLVASLDLKNTTPGNPYAFDFGFSQDYTLAPGATATLTKTLINAGFDNTTSYTLGFDAGATVNGVPTTFDYSVQVQIGAPPATT